MANENQKDFNAMLHEPKDMPKIQTITDEKSIQKYGGNRMYFAPPLDYDNLMKQIPYGKLTTVGAIREHFAKRSGSDFTEPITAGIFVSIAAWASFQRTQDETPYWRTPEGGRCAEPQISRGRPGPAGKAGSRRTYNHPKGAQKHRILRKGLRKRPG